MAGPIDPSALPAPVREVCARLAAAGHEAWVVGGCVRDLLLGRTPKDWDVATAARPEQVQRLFRRTIPTGIKHGTLTVLAGEGEARQPVEVTTYRGEGAYSDGRRPDSVVFVPSIEEDLARRDFTINAIAADPAGGRLIDPFGGARDLEARLVRAVGDPLARLREDGLRALRAVRFCATLGCSLDEATRAAIPRTLDVVRKVSAERVRDELVKILGAPRPSVALVLMRDVGLLEVVLPELLEGVGQPQNRFHRHDVFDHTMACVDATRGDWVVRLAALLHDVAKPRTAAPREDAPGELTFFKHDQVGAELSEQVLRRLRFSNRERERVVGLVGHHMFWYTPEWTDASVRRFLRRVGPDQVDDLFALREGDVRARGRDEDPEAELGALRARIARVLEEQQALRISDLAVGGADVMQALGRPPGPLIGRVLRRLLDRVIDEPGLNERERLLALLPEAVRAAEGEGGPDAGPPQGGAGGSGG